ncbi:ornithine carbamoyltransferase [Thermotomaculum hydrothermale]|uniref:Ornithine carbamoyltransferase n=1 Tax=Thermotomaculum hydrothermale TaxID=981385 RepID=A0A7R6PL40_9BACT|nr:ornithine carbamoyltransferase [Thermotomaculum hydrothermale]BBB32107.1 ornithine carbamoyltransferase [Thermotomaculum hydrothermale]
MKHLLTLKDVKREEIFDIYNTADKLVENSGEYADFLKNKVIGLYFQKVSTRSRFAFESGIYRLGGNAIYFKTSELQLSRGESIFHTAKALSCYLDALVIRALSHQDVEDFANFGSIPVINSMSGMYIPIVALNIGYTVRKLKGELDNLNFVYVGDGYNTCHSLMLFCSLIGINLTVITPKDYEPNPEVVENCKEFCKKSGANLKVTNDLNAVEGADVIVTDVWVSIGMEDEKEKRRKDFKGYTVNSELVKKTGKEDVLIFHPMPLRIGEEICSDVRDRLVINEYTKNLMYVSQSILVNIFSKEEE